MFSEHHTTLQSMGGVLLLCRSRSVVPAIHQGTDHAKLCETASGWQCNYHLSFVTHTRPPIWPQANATTTGQASLLQLAQLYSLPVSLLHSYTPGKPGTGPKHA